MKYIKLFYLIILVLKVSFAYTQVVVKFKCNGIYKEIEYDNYEECGCKVWNVDYYKNGSNVPWGMAHNENREALEAEIKQAISNDYNLWKKTSSDHERYVIYCGDDNCGTSKTTTVDNSLVAKINNAIKRLRDELDKLKKAYDDFPIVDRAGAGLVGYLEFYNEAFDASVVAGNKALAYQNQPMKDLEEALNSIVHDLDNYNFEASSKVVHIFAEKDKKSKQIQEETNRINYQNQQVESQKAKQRELEYQQNQLQKQLDENAVNFKKAQEQQTEAIQEFGDAILNAMEEKYTPAPKTDYTYTPEPAYTYVPKTNTVKSEFRSINIPTELNNGITEVVNSGSEIKTLYMGSDNSYCLIFADNAYKTNGLKPEMLTELKRCNDQKLHINVASCYGSNGWVVINEDNGYSYNGIPDGAVTEIKRCNTEKLKIRIIAFTPTGGWVVVNGDNGYNYSSIPNDLAAKMKECNEKEWTINSIAFTPSEGWVIVFDSNGYMYNSIPTEAVNELKAYNSSGKKISFVSFSQTGYVIY